MPRVDVGGAGRDHRHRQGQCLARGRPRRRTGRARSGRTPAPTTRGCSARWRRPSATAPGSWRSTRCARPGCVRFDNPQTPARPGRRRARRWPISTSRSGSTATSPCSRRSARCSSSGAAIDQRLRRAPHRRVRAVGGAPAEPSTGRVVERATGLVAPRRSRRRREMFADVEGDRHLLGDGHHPAPQRRGDDPGDRQRRPRPGQHRQARRRPVSGARPLQRAGRPHDGDLGASTVVRSSTPSRDEFGFEPPRDHGLDTVESIRALRDGQAKVFIAHRRQLRRRHAGHRGRRGGDAAAPNSPCRSRPSSTARTPCPDARR